MPNQPLVELATCQEALRDAVAARVRLGAKVMVLESALRQVVTSLRRYGRHASVCKAFPATSEEQVRRDCDCGLERVLAQAREALEGKPS